MSRLSVWLTSLSRWAGPAAAASEPATRRRTVRRMGVKDRARWVTVGSLRSGRRPRRRTRSTSWRSPPGTKQAKSYQHALQHRLQSFTDLDRICAREPDTRSPEAHPPRTYPLFGVAIGAA